MSLVQLKIEHDLPGLAQGTHLRLARGARNAAERMSVRAKLRLRQNVLQGGLGRRVANAWRADVYPRSASARTLSPAVFIFTKAPKIVLAFSQATTIRNKNGIFLAIPTRDVPRTRQGRPLSVEEAQERFGKNLVLVQGGGGAHRQFGAARGGIALLVLRDLKIRAKTGRWRNASQREIARGASHDVVMFVLVRQVHLRKRLDTARIFDDLSREWPDIYAAEVARALAAGTN